MSTPVKKIVLSVNINCEKCKMDLLKTVTKLSGIDEVTAEAEKNTLTIIGVVDPVLIVQRLRKARKFAEIVSVGPPKPPEPQPKVLSPVVLPPCCNDCQLVGFRYDSHGGYYGGSGCNIL